MGKGDKKTYRGKLFMGSHGKKRPKVKNRYSKSDSSQAGTPEAK